MSRFLLKQMFTEQQQKLFERKGGKESRYTKKWQKLVRTLGVLFVVILALLGIGLGLFTVIYTNNIKDMQRKDTVIPIIQDAKGDSKLLK